MKIFFKIPLVLAMPAYSPSSILPSYCLFSFVDVSLESSDMCAPFAVSTKARELLRDHRGRDSRKGK